MSLGFPLVLRYIYTPAGRRSNNFLVPSGDKRAEVTLGLGKEAGTNKTTQQQQQQKDYTKSTGPNKYLTNEYKCKQHLHIPGDCQRPMISPSIQNTMPELTTRLVCVGTLRGILQAVSVNPMSSQEAQRNDLIL